MSYVQELRAVVGHRAVLLPCTGVIITDENDRLLLQQRTDDESWGILGGAIEPGETPEESVRREAHEEAGIDLGRLQLFDVFGGPDFFIMYPNGDQAHLVCIVYLCHEFRGDLKCDPTETLALQTFDREEIPSHMGRANRAMIEAYLNRKPLSTAIGEEELPF